MKKLCRKSPSSVVHPSPPSISEQQLSFLPASIFTLTLALSPEDREVLAYLLSCSSNNHFSAHHKKKKKDTRYEEEEEEEHHPPRPAVFGCSCFRCYKSFWARWDASPNRELIHEVIDAFEEDELVKKRESKGKNHNKEKKKNKGRTVSGKRPGSSSSTELNPYPTRAIEELIELDDVQNIKSGADQLEVSCDVDDEDLLSLELEKGSSWSWSSSPVKKLVSLIGADRIWRSIIWS